MTKPYTQLTQEERYQITAYIAADFSTAEIAAAMGRHITTIYRELARNTGLRGYRANQAQRLASERHRTKNKFKKLDNVMMGRIAELIILEWSPEQISGWLEMNESLSISTETIYQYLLSDKSDGGELYKHLRHQHKRKKKRYGSPDTRGQIPNRVSIDERPKVVDDKTRLGDWEGDTVIGKGHKGVLVTLTERVSKVTLIAKVSSKSAADVTEAIIELLEPYKAQTHTITFDNGKEFSYHAEIASTLDVDVYFAHAYSSWERGLNENHNGLIRQYFKKNSSLENITTEDVDFVMMRLNNRPRKLIGYRTPIEVFESMAFG